MKETFEFSEFIDQSEFRVVAQKLEAFIDSQNSEANITCTMCDFAHFGLMIFFQNVSFSMQDIEVTYQIFAKFYGFIVKYRFQI